MSANSYLYRMPSGIPGATSRDSVSTIEALPLNSSLPFAGYGIPGKIASGAFVPFAGSETAAACYGFLVRPYPTTGVNASDPLGTAVPATSGIANVLRRGYMTVHNNAGTPALNGAVYIRVASAAAGKPIGGIEAAADSTNTVLLTNAIFMSAADANGNVEIAYNI